MFKNFFKNIFLFVLLSVKAERMNQERPFLHPTPPFPSFARLPVAFPHGGDATAPTRRSFIKVCSPHQRGGINYLSLSQPHKVEGTRSKVEGSLPFWGSWRGLPSPSLLGEDWGGTPFSIIHFYCLRQLSFSSHCLQQSHPCYPQEIVDQVRDEGIRRSILCRPKGLY